MSICPNRYASSSFSSDSSSSVFSTRSNGLKAKFDLVEKTDEELSEEKEDEAYLLGQIDIDQWRDVLKVDARGIVLELASLKGWTAVENFLFVIKGAHDPTTLAAPVTLDIVREARELLLAA
nr:hypothetical protein [Comamonas jiangduensis]